MSIEGYVSILPICFLLADGRHGMGQHTTNLKQSILSDREALTKHLVDSSLKRPSDDGYVRSLYGEDLTTSFRTFWVRVSQRRNLSHVDSLVNIGRFVGLIEKSLGVEPPEWWIDALIRSGQNGTPFPASAEYKRVGFGDKLQTFRGQRYRITDRQIALRSGRKTTSEVLESVLRNAPQSQKYIELGESDDILLCALYSDWAMSYHLFALDVKNNKSMWKSEIWAGAYAAGSGSSFHYVDLLISNGKAIIFGCDGACVYIEGFDTKSGSPLVRFHSSLWGVDKPKLR